MDRSRVKGILFDLDHTLWDFVKNSREAIHDIFLEENVTSKYNVSFEPFHKHYVEVNDRMWAQYRDGKLSREELRIQRFSKSFELFDVNDNALNEIFANRYVELSPYKNHLFPNTHKVMQYLSSKYPIAIITNGFNEVQTIKIKENNLNQYFKTVVTSEDTGHKKPAAQIFHLACANINVAPNNCVMIGDDWDADMEGAKNAGLQRIHFDPNNLHQQKVECRINNLLELKTLL